LLDPTNFLLVLLASGTIFYGSHRSLSLFKASVLQPNKDRDGSSEVNTRTAIILPVVGSIFLIILFYLLTNNWMLYLLLVLISISSISGMAFCTYPIFVKICSRLKWDKKWELRYIGEVNIAGILSMIFALAFVAVWIALLFTGNEYIFIPTDVLAMSLGISALSSLVLPNLKISVILLSLFFIYDIFWVFISKYIFPKNVMITVASSLPTFPMMVVLPRFLDHGESILGLGDIALPGLFLCFLYRFDYFNKIPFRSGYFLRAWIGYIMGLLITFLMVWATQAGQPALLYLVPCTILPTVFFGWRRKQLEDLWKGLYHAEHLDVEEEDQVTLLEDFSRTVDDE